MLFPISAVFSYETGQNHECLINIVDTDGLVL